ncbi:MAG: hypothetical protein WC511_03170 [Candidatus Pacearchaeota archaeon]
MTEEIKAPEFKTLSPSFFKRTTKSQISHIVKYSGVAEKIEEYKRALKDGLCKLEVLTRKQFADLTKFGVEVPLEFRPPMTDKVKNALLSKRHVDRLWMEFGIKAPDAMLPVKKPRVKKTPAA